VKQKISHEKSIVVVMLEKLAEGMMGERRVKQSLGCCFDHDASPNKYIPAISTFARSKFASITLFKFQSKRKEMPQSLESSRGVGISLTFCLARTRTASACIAEELV
jgi:hypothetical protein